MRQQWSSADLLDLEYFLSRDQELVGGAAEGRLAERDRAIYLQIKDSCQQNAPSIDRGSLLHQWLARRRLDFYQKNTDGVVLPGRLFQELIRISAWGLFLLALIAGWGMAQLLLRYSGTTPINVSTFLGLFVGTQFFLLFALLISCVVARIARHDPFPVTHTLLRKGIFLLIAKLGRLSGNGNTHRLLTGLFSRLQQQRKVYGALLALPFFIRIQLAGTGFNLGVLAATLLTVVGKDVAFGWQSTLQPGAETVYRLVQLIALPWSWALPAGIAHPDLAQIEGSQMILKEGIYHLATGDLVSWWPFLCFAVAVYGLLPRICLLTTGWFVNRSLLDRLEFNTALQQQLLHRMLTPRLSTESKKEAKTSPVVERVPEPEANDGPVVFCDQVLALIPDEIFDDCVGEEFSRLVRKRLGMQIKHCLRIQGEGNEEQKNLEFIGQNVLSGNASILLLQEAWQPPIEEFFSFVRELRSSVGEKVLLGILLIGKPTAETIFTEVREQDYSIWQQKLVMLGDPYLQCLQLVRS